jgi:hypothetical protein
MSYDSPSEPDIRHPSRRPTMHCAETTGRTDPAFPHGRANAYRYIRRSVAAIALDAAR